MRAIAALALALPYAVFSQPEAGTPKFEVASVRAVNAPGRSFPVMTGGPGTDDPQRVHLVMSMTQLLQAAFGLDRGPDQMSGPAWIANEWYEISATVPGGATHEQFNQMLQNLLAERFQLKFHRESHQVSGYELVAGKDGPKLKPTSDLSSAPPASGVPFSRPTFDKEGFPEFPAGVSGTRFSVAEDGTMHVAGRNQSIYDLILTITTSLNDQKRVVDKTGLTGKYDFRMDLDAGGGFRRPGLGARPDDDPRGPDIFAALEKYLGLKLQKAQITIETLVIDRLEKVPSEN